MFFCMVCPTPRSTLTDTLLPDTTRVQSLYGYGRSGQTLTFIGDTGTSEMASYAYEVLARQLTDSRRNYLSGFQFASPSHKRRAGDLYAESWITSRSEEHTSELQSLMRISYVVFCLKKKTIQTRFNH